MKKIAMILTSLMLGASAYAGEGVQMKLEGAFDFQAASRQQKNLGIDNKITNNQKNQAFYSQAALRVNVSNETDFGMKYGAVFGVRTTSKTKVFGGDNGSYLYLQSDAGKLEAGSRQDASSMLSQSAYNIASGTGDDWTRYFRFAPKIYTDSTGAKVGAYNMVDNDYGYVSGGAFGSKLDNSPEMPRSITYYIPKTYGLQVGVTYTPDSGNVGDGTISNGTSVTQATFFDKTNGYNQIDAKVSVKNMISAGVTFEHALTDDLGVVIGAGVTQGKTKVTGASITTTPGGTVKEPTTIKLADYKVYNVGAVVSYGNWSVAGSYANEGKSFTAAQYFFDTRSSKSYTAGVAYNQGPMGVSLTFLQSDKYKNKQNSYTLGTQYKLAPGLMPYFEVTSVQFKGKGYDMWTTPGTPTAVKKNTSGMVYMLGTKVSF